MLSFQKLWAQASLLASKQTPGLPYNDGQSSLILSLDPQPWLILILETSYFNSQETEQGRSDGGAFQLAH